MGLDQYAYRIKMANVKDDLNFKAGTTYDNVTKLDDLGNNMDFAYWRKFYPLDGWMRQLYAAKGGDDKFNCRCVRLEEEDLDKLYSEAQNLDFYEGGYCSSAQEEKEYEYNYLMEFIKRAKEAIDEGDAIYYSNWW